MVMHFYLDLPLTEAAEILDIPVGTAKSRLHRGLATLREALAQRAAGSVQRRPGASGMSDTFPLERSIAAWMADEGRAARDDAVLDQILSTTGRSHPQPRWLVLVKEPPMRINSRVAVGSPTRRLVLIAAIVLLALAAGAAVAAQVVRPPLADDWPSCSWILGADRCRGQWAGRPSARTLDVQRRLSPQHQYRHRGRPRARVGR